MKAIILLVAVALTGCAPIPYQQRYYAPPPAPYLPPGQVQMPNTQVIPASGYDAQCMRTCLNAKFAYGLCQKNCTY